MNKKRLLLSPKGEKCLVNEKEVLSFLKQGYTIPIQLVYLFNGVTKDIKHIKTEYKSSHTKIIQYLENGYEFTTASKMTPLKKDNVLKLSDMLPEIPAAPSTPEEETLKSLKSKVEDLEKELLRKKEEFEIFRQLSQINVKVSKDLHKENELLRDQLSQVSNEKPVVNNFIAQHLLEIISSNPLEEVVLTNKGNMFSFSGIVRVKNK